MIHFRAKAEPCAGTGVGAGRRRGLDAEPMAHRKKLLTAGIAGVALVALAPHAHRLWQETRERDREAQRLLFIELKNREIACLEALVADGLPKGADVQAEIERCRRLAVDPATGEVAKDPSAL